MGTARKVAKNDSVKGGAKGAAAGSAFGPVGTVVGGVAGAVIGDKKINKALDSATGKTSKRNKAAKQKAAEDTAKKASASVSSSAEATKVSAQGQKNKFEGMSRDVDKATSERIARSDVSDVTTGTLAGKTATAATIDQAPQAQFRQTQRSLGAQLAATAAGQGTTPAQLQLQQATEANIAQQAAARAGVGGAGAALARREIGRVGAQTAQQGAQQASLLRAQETSQAQQQLGQLAGQARGQDIGMATSQAGLEQQAFLQSSAQEQQAMLATAENDLKAQLANQGVDLAVLKDNAARGDATSMANLQSQLAQVGMNDAMIKCYMAQELGATGIQANIATNQASNVAAASAAANAAAAQQQAGIMGGIATLGAAAIPAMVAASDINLKTNIKDGKKSIGEFLSSLNSYDYDYKDDKFGKGKQTSVMAQDLEKTGTGKKAVVDTKEGKMVDYTKLLPSMLAGLADTHQEVMSLKEALKRRKK